MPSSFTQNLGLEKPATGEQAGVWGVTANISYDSIDQATDGNLPIQLSANAYQLGTSQGAPSEGRNKVIVWGGALTQQATVNILPNTAQKLYAMRNRTAGGFAIAFQQGTGGSFVLQSGHDALVYADGAGSGARVAAALDNPQFASVLVSGLIINVAGQTNATYDLYYRSASGSLANLPVGMPGQVLMVAAGPSIAWHDASGLQTPWVTNIDGAGHTLANVALLAVGGANLVGRPVYVHAGANENLTIGPAEAVGGAVTIEAANDVWSANIPLEIRASVTAFMVGNVGIATATTPDPLTVNGLGFGQIRMVYGGYGVVLRNDQTDFYVLVTNAGDPWGGFNGLRPFMIDLSTGRVGIGAQSAYPLTVGGDLNITGTYRVNGTPLGTGQPQSPWLSTINGNGNSLSNVGSIGCVSLVASGISAGSYAAGGLPGLNYNISVAGPGATTTVVLRVTGGLVTGVTFQ